MRKRKLKPFRVAEVFGKIVPVHRVVFPEEQDLHGVYVPDTGQIGLSNDLVGKELEKVLMHEILHALYDRLYIDAQLDDKLVEVIIENTVQCVFENWQVKWRR